MKALVEYIDTKETEMLEFLEKLVNIDSGSYNKAGVDQIGDVLAERLAVLDFSVQRSPQKEFGDHVIVNIWKYQLLLKEQKLPRSLLPSGQKRATHKRADGSGELTGI